MTERAIEVTNLSKKYRIYDNPKDRVREALSVRGKKFHKDFWALRDVSFSLDRGRTLGIMGINGSGKSTLLKIICGYLAPTGGSVRIRGRISSILELGTGFNREFTGRENALLFGGLMGLSKRDMMDRLPDVEAFADIGDFFNRPLRLYSSGMYARLAFACTVHVDPEILIIDEALAVGDIAFQFKCMDRIRKLQEGGVTILLVSHSMGAIKSLCQKGLFLERGSVVREGSAEDVANYYHGLLAKKEEARSRPPAAKAKEAPVVGNGKAPIKTAMPEKKGETRVGTGEIRIEEVRLVDFSGTALKAVDFDEEITVSVVFRAFRACRPEVAGFIIRDRFGVELLGTNTAVEGIELPDMKAGERVTVRFRLRLPLLKGHYSVTAAVGYDPDRPVFYDWYDHAAVFEMLPPRDRKIVNCKVHLPVETVVQEPVPEGEKESRS